MGRSAPHQLEVVEARGQGHFSLPATTASHKKEAAYFLLFFFKSMALFANVHNVMYLMLPCMKSFPSSLLRFIHSHASTTKNSSELSLSRSRVQNYLEIWETISGV